MTTQGSGNQGPAQPSVAPGGMPVAPPGAAVATPKKHPGRGPTFRLVILLSAAVLVVAIANLAGFLGNVPFGLHHPLVIAGALWIAVFVPVRRVLSARLPGSRARLMSLHIYGNLVALLLISTHFAQQFGHVLNDEIRFGTGLPLYVAMALLVLTGIFLRFGFAKKRRPQWRYAHVALGLLFYVLIVIHVAHGLGYL